MQRFDGMDPSYGPVTYLQLAPVEAEAVDTMRRRQGLRGSLTGPVGMMIHSCARDQLGLAAGAEPDFRDLMESMRLCGMNALRRNNSNESASITVSCKRDCFALAAGAEPVSTVAAEISQQVVLAYQHRDEQ